MVSVQTLYSKSVSGRGNSRRFGRKRNDSSCRAAGYTDRVGRPLFRLLGSVTATSLLAVADAQGVEHAANDLVTNTGKVADTAATDEHDRVFLQVVAFAGNVGGDFLAVGQAD